MKNRTNLPWKLCCAGVVALSILCFTPLIIPEDVYEPMLLGLPRSLWASMLIAFFNLLLAVIGIYVHPNGSDIECGQDNHADNHE